MEGVPAVAAVITGALLVFAADVVGAVVVLNLPAAAVPCAGAGLDAVGVLTATGVVTVDSEVFSTTTGVVSAGLLAAVTCTGAGLDALVVLTGTGVATFSATTCAVGAAECFLSS